jgi:hypothetical protein
MWRAQTVKIARFWPQNAYFCPGRSWPPGLGSEPSDNYDGWVTRRQELSARRALLVVLRPRIGDQIIAKSRAAKKFSISFRREHKTARAKEKHRGAVGVPV